MIRLHVVQAEYGDCFILESKIGKKSRNILIDGGPYQTFEKHLKPTLQKLPLIGKLDLIVLSHIDNDHIMGLLNLLAEIKNQRERGTKELVSVEKIWHNSFGDLLQFYDEPTNLLGTFFTDRYILQEEEITMSLVLKGFQQGTDLDELANSLKIPINPDFDKLIVVNDKIKTLRFDHMTVHLLGPTKKNVDKLQKEWKNWCRKKKTGDTAAGLLQVLDKSVPNLASITFLAEIIKKTILFTGDGIGQDIVDILSKNDMLNSNGKFYVDVLKIPHHGSDRNTSPEFFNTVTAKYYIISANGRDDNPSFDTLKWIIDSENRDRRPKKIILTNMTPNVMKVIQQYDQTKFRYEIIILEKKSHFLTIDL